MLETNSYKLLVLLTLLFYFQRYYMHLFFQSFHENVIQRK